MFQMFFKLIVLETIIASSIEDFAMNSELNKLKSFVKKKSYLNETIYAINTKIDHSPKCDNLCAKGSINHATDHFTCFMIKNGY